MSLKGIDTVVLCGGKATRLANTLPYGTPKCLAMIGDKPYLDWLMLKLQRHGAQNIFLVTGHGEDDVVDWLVSRPDDKLDFQIVPDRRREGTCYAYTTAAELASETSLVVNGDTMTDANLSAMADEHRRDNPEYSMLMATDFTDRKIKPAGFTIIGPHMRKRIMRDPHGSLDRWFPVRHKNSVIVEETFYDIGTPDRLAGALPYFEQVRWS